MPRITLTPRLVDTLEVLSGRTRTEYLDTHPSAPKGFALRVSSTGARAFYLIRSIKAKGRRVKVHLGPAQGAGLDAARTAAWARAGEIAIGRDPNAEARQARSRERLERIKRSIESDEWTVAAMVTAYLQVKTASLSIISYRGYRRDLVSMIDGTELGDKLAREVTKDDVRRFLARVVVIRTHPMAARALVLLRAAFRWAMDEETVALTADGQRVLRPRVERDPTRRVENDVPKIRNAMRRQRTRHLSDDEIVALWRGVDNLKACWSTFARLVLLCGTRRGETYRARWANVHLDAPAPFWFIPAEDRKGRIEGSFGARRPLTVPLSPLAVRLLQEYRPLTIRSGRVFVGLQVGAVGKHVKAASGIPDVSIHDLRRTVASGLQRLGAPPHVISVVLGHAREAGAMQTDSAYTHDPRAREHRAWLERWAAHVAGIVGSGAVKGAAVKQGGHGSPSGRE